MKLLLSKDKKYFLIKDISLIEMDDLREHLTYTLPYIHALKRKYPWKYANWDGKQCFIDKKLRIPKGLWSEVYSFAKKNNIPLEIYGISNIIDNNFKFDEFKEFCLNLFKDHPIYTPYEYQIKAAGKILKYKFSQSEIATSAGKTLISYMIFMWLKSKGFKKQLIIVPRIILINQLIDDFNNYANGKYEFHYQKIEGGSDKLKKDVDFVIGSYQSLTKLPETWFNEIDSLFVDEAHHVKSASIKKIILKNINHLKISYGMSGTIDEKNRGNMLTTQSFLGPVIQHILPEYLIDNGFISNIDINVYKLDYLPYEYRKKLREIRLKSIDKASESLAIEKDTVRNNNQRFKFICNKIIEAKQNSLVLFSDIKNGYGKRFYDYLKVNSDKRIYYIDGGTKKEIREYYKKVMEDDNAILVSSFGTVGEGVSINNIANVFLTESYKSRTVIMQAVGRGLRKHADKTKVIIYDFIDDFRIKKEKGGQLENYVWRHGKERIKYYKQYFVNAKNTNFTIKNVKLNNENNEIFKPKLKQNTLF